MLIKTISIRQPWAWAIFHAGKNVENRDWPCKYRGPLLIHASKKFDRDGYIWISKHHELLNIPWQSFPDEQDFFLKGSGYGLGGIIGQVDMIGCVKNSDSKWFFGEYGFVFDNPKPLPFFPCKGQLGIFEVDYAE